VITAVPYSGAPLSTGNQTHAEMIKV